MKQLVLVVMLLLPVWAAGQGRGPKVSFGKLENGATSTIAELLAQGGFMAEDTAAKVQSFVMSVQFESGDVSGIHRIKGDKLDAKGRQILERISGTRGILFLEEIKLQKPEAYTKVLSPIRIRFTE